MEVFKEKDSFTKVSCPRLRFSIITELICLGTEKLDNIAHCDSFKIGIILVSLLLNLHILHIYYALVYYFTLSILNWYLELVHIFWVKLNLTVSIVQFNIIQCNIAGLSILVRIQQMNEFYPMGNWATGQQYFLNLLKGELG